LAQCLRVPALGFRKADQQRCGGGVPRQGIDEPGSTQLPRPSTHVVISAFCAPSSERTHRVVLSYLDFLRRSTLIKKLNGLASGAFAQNTSPSPKTMPQTSNKLQENSGDRFPFVIVVGCVGYCALSHEPPQDQSLWGRARIEPKGKSCYVGAF
jgi:hypothetical protein